MDVKAPLDVERERSMDMGLGEGKQIVVAVLNGDS